MRVTSKGGYDMKRIRFIGFSVLILLLFSLTSALARSWEIDKAHTNFYFTVDHIFSKVRGVFNEYTGEIVFDPDNLAGSRFYFEIKVDSINTNIAKRDKHLQSPDFFDAGQFPLLTFESKTITDKGEGRYDVAGVFTVKGVSYDLVLPLQLAGVKEHPAVRGKDVAGFNGTLTIDRLAYKIGTGKFYDLGVVGKNVDILVTIEALSEKK